jgi:hypothetical protein
MKRFLKNHRVLPAVGVSSMGWMLQLARHKAALDVLRLMPYSSHKLFTILM